MKMVERLKSWKKKKDAAAEKKRFEQWIRAFTDKMVIYVGETCACAEAELWAFAPAGNEYDWREHDPEEAAREALSYYAD